MVGFLGSLFDTSDFMPRWYCGSWTPAQGWLHIISDLAIWSAYMAIPLLLGYFVIRRRDLPFRWMFWLFCAFIFACGTTHLIEAIIFWKPIYRIGGVVKFATAVVSWSTVVALVPLTPRVLSLRSPAELERKSPTASGPRKNCVRAKPAFATPSRTRQSAWACAALMGNGFRSTPCCATCSATVRATCWA